MIRKNQGILTQIYAFCDFIVIQLVFFIAWWIKFDSGWIPSVDPLPKSQYYLWIFVYSIVMIGFGFFVNFYSPKRKKNFSFEVFKILQVNSVSLLILISLLFIYKAVHISREYLAVFLALNIIVMACYRYAVKMSLRNLRRRGYNKQL
jgi:FlaA1/EpsC-like NDP-sugar epimerase